MTIQIYDVGTVSVSTGGTTVSAASGGPLWLSSVKELDWLVITGFGPVKIMGIVDDGHITISPWPYANVTNSAYQIVKDGLNSFTAGSVAQAVVELVEDLDADGFYIFVSSTETYPNPRKGDEGQYARKPSTGEEWVKTLGVWTYLGISGNITLSQVPWSAATTYQQRTIVSRRGMLYLSLQNPNLNHIPETSPTYWQAILSGGDAYDVCSFDTDRPASNELVLKLVFTKTVTFYAGISDSRAQADVAATVTSYYSFFKNGVGFANIQFVAGNPVGVCNANETTFSPGDIMTVYAPTTRDATLSGVSFTLSGYRS